MDRFIVVSSIGTSLLTNAARDVLPPASTLLRDTANATARELSAAEKAQIDSIADHAALLLTSGDLAQVARLSAELNGIIKYYGSRITDPRHHTQDQHYLIATDTYQGRTTSTLAAGWLTQTGFAQVVPVPVPGLSVANEEAFRTGISHLIRWCTEMLAPLRNEAEDARGRRPHIVFNLVGGFNSLQAYLNTLGMLYADEIVYIFEGPGSSLIRIPRLPVKTTEAEAVRAHAGRLLLLAKHGALPQMKVARIPEALLEQDAHGMVTLSDWGLAVWEANKKDILATCGLLDFPRLEYSPTFREDFANLEPQDKAAVLETLAEVSVLLEGGRDSELSAGGLRFKELAGSRGLCSFRVSRDMRVTCVRERGRTLLLEKVGGHDVVDSGL